jgi:hypothetical protein
MSRYVPKHLRQAGAEIAEVYTPGHTPSTGPRSRPLPTSTALPPLTPTARPRPAAPTCKAGRSVTSKTFCSWPSTAPQLTLNVYSHVLVD